MQLLYLRREISRRAHATASPTFRAAASGALLGAALACVLSRFWVPPPSPVHLRDWCASMVCPFAHVLGHAPRVSHSLPVAGFVRGLPPRTMSMCACQCSL